MTTFSRNWLGSVFSGYLLKSSFSLKTPGIIVGWRSMIFWVVVAGVLGLLKGSLTPLWYGSGFLFSLLAVVPFVPGRGLPGTLVVAALGDLVNWTGCFRARRFPHLWPAGRGHALFVLGGILAGCMVLACLWPIIFYAVTGRRGHPLFSDYKTPFRFAYLLVVMFHLAVTSYCLNWCQRGRGQGVYAILHLLGIIVGGHLLWLFRQPIFTAAWQFFLEGGLLGLFSLAAAELYWRGWHIRKPAPAELSLFLAESPTPGGSPPSR